MTSIATLALVLYILGVFGVFAQSVSVSLGPIAPGWFGVGLGGVAFLLTEFPG